MRTIQKQIILFSCFFILTTFSAKGQSSVSDTNRIIKPKTQYSVFLALKVNYPELAKKKKIEGTVTISFDIDSTCSVVNRKVVNGIGYGCDEEALKVMDQYEISLKNSNKSGCDPQKDMRFPVKFTIPK